MTHQSRDENERKAYAHTRWKKRVNTKITEINQAQNANAIETYTKNEIKKREMTQSNKLKKLNITNDLKWGEIPTDEDGKKRKHTQ